jgi:hypothetical protein
MALALAADKVWKATRVQEIFVKSPPDPLAGEIRMIIKHATKYRPTIYMESSAMRRIKNSQMGARALAAGLGTAGSERMQISEGTQSN